MTSKLHQKVCHDVKNMSWCQKVHHDFQKYVPTTKSLSWRSKSLSLHCKAWGQSNVITSKVRYDVKTTLWCQRYIKDASWRHKVCHVKNTSWCQSYIMKSQIHHDVKNMSCHPKVHQDIKKYIMTLKSMSWNQRNVMQMDWFKWIDFIECFTTTFLRAHSWLNWVDEDDDEVGLKEKPEDIRYIKKITSK